MIIENSELKDSPDYKYSNNISRLDFKTITMTEITGGHSMVVSSSLQSYIKSEKWTNESAAYKPRPGFLCVFHTLWAVGRKYSITA